MMLIRIYRVYFVFCVIIGKGKINYYCHIRLLAYRGFTGNDIQDKS